LDPLYEKSTIDAIRTLKADAEALADTMAVGTQTDIDRWKQAVDTGLLPRLTAEFPLVAAICGSGSSGKSTLFNTLVGEGVSPTGGLAGINRRILVALSATHQNTPDIAQALYAPFDCPPQPLAAMDQLTTPGDPLLYYANALPAGLSLFDTPDFDTGADGTYQNREMAEKSLTAADILIYIFTNAGYNNRDNTDFMARMLTSVGVRRCFLVYRVSSAFTDDEVLEHAATVTRNLYGEQHANPVLGIYRAGEDNRVASGQRPMTIVPVQDGQPGFVAALTQIDPRQTRRDLHQTVFDDVVRQSRVFLQAAQVSKAHLSLYLESVRMVQRTCVQKALGHLPMDAVIRRFSEIWQETDPSHVKIMRKTGQVVEAPIRLMMRAVDWLGGKKREENGLLGGGESAAAMESDFIKAANTLREAVVGPAIDIRLPATDPAADKLLEDARQLAESAGVTVRRRDAREYGLHVPVHPALTQTQSVLRSENWSALVADMLTRQAALLSLTTQLEGELKELVIQQRARMTTGDQIRQTVAAMLNIIPATAAVTYVLHTGDPVGATGIKVNLFGLLGLNNLVALVAIPATAGMKKADLKQLEALLSPVAGAWLAHKLKGIDALFEEKISGALLQNGRNMIKATAKRIDSMADGLTRCERVLEKR
jgi:hypothetical protein